MQYHRCDHGDCLISQVLNFHLLEYQHQQCQHRFLPLFVWVEIVVVTMNLFSKQDWIPMSLVSEGTSSSKDIYMSLSFCFASANDPLLLGASMFSNV